MFYSWYLLFYLNIANIRRYPTPFNHSKILCLLSSLIFFHIPHLNIYIHSLCIKYLANFVRINCTCLFDPLCWTDRLFGNRRLFLRLSRFRVNSRYVDSFKCISAVPQVFAETSIIFSNNLRTVALGISPVTYVTKFKRMIDIITSSNWKNKNRDAETHHTHFVITKWSFQQEVEISHPLLQKRSD